MSAEKKYIAPDGVGQDVRISSRANPLVKKIRALESRKEREQSGLFFVEGLHLVVAAVQQGAVIELCVFAPELLVSPIARDLLSTLRERGIRCVETTADVFHSVAAKERAQGLGLVVRQRWEPLATLQPTPAQCWVALDAVQYPGNLGTILRTCDAVGGAGMFLFGNTTDPYDPAAVRASVGAIFAQRLVRASVAEFTSWRNQHGVQVVGTSPAATVDYHYAAYHTPLVLLMGSEARGLAPEQLALCDTVITIPMVGSSDSLNLAVATSVVLYEIFNRRRVNG